MKKTKNFNIKGMAQIMGVHDYDIKLILGIPLVACTAKTIAQAHIECANAQEYSEKKEAAWQRWNQLEIINLDQATTRDEVVEVRIHCPSGSPSQEKAICKELSLCTSLEEVNLLKSLVFIHVNSKAHKAYLKLKWELSSTPCQLKELLKECPEKTESINIVNEKWYSVSWRAISVVRNYEEMEKLFYDLSPRTYAKAIGKWLEVCRSAKEVQKLYRTLFNKRAPYLICHEAFIENMHSRWIDFSYEEMRASRNFEEAMATQAYTPENSKIRIEATEKCLAFADNFDLIEEVYIHAPNNYELKMKIFWKWLLFSAGIAEMQRLFIFFSDKSPRPEDMCQEYVVLDRTEIITAITKKIAFFYGYQEK